MEANRKGSSCKLRTKDKRLTGRPAYISRRVVVLHLPKCTAPLLYHLRPHCPGVRTLFSGSDTVHVGEREEMGREDMSNEGDVVVRVAEDGAEYYIDHFTQVLRSAMQYATSATIRPSKRS